MDEVTDEPLYRDRVCGIDIGKAAMVATIRVPSDNNPARRAQETRSFGTTKREVLALADWLRSWQVPALVMESTGDGGGVPAIVADGAAAAAVRPGSSWTRATAQDATIATAHAAAAPCQRWCQIPRHAKKAVMVTACAPPQPRA